MIKQENFDECALTILTIMLASVMTGIPVADIGESQIRDAASLVKVKKPLVMMMFGKPII